MNAKPNSFRHLWLGTAAMFALALVPLAATLGDFGITWDEPVYSESQRLQAEWFARLAAVRSWNELGGVLSREATHDLWMSARYGLNFHPPLAGMLSNLTNGAFGGWMYELNARRLASALELAAAAAMLFCFLGRRYGLGVGAVAGASLVLTPRLFGHGHIAGTDMPVLFFWFAAALAYWKGQASPRWRFLFAVLLALGFLTKLSTIFVVAPLAAWQVFEGWRTRSREKPSPSEDSATRFEIGTFVVRGAILLLVASPLIGVAWETRRLADGMKRYTQSRLPPTADPQRYLPYVHLLEPGVTTRVPGWVLFVPALVYSGLLLARRRAARWNRVPTWLNRGGVGFETTLLVLAVCPATVLALNPGWWRDTLIRIAHYQALFAERKAALPDFEILYLGQKYRYNLPWHNGWVLTAVTVPLGILLLSVVGCGRAIWDSRRDPAPMFLLLNAAALPVLRMFPTPAHDGVRLMLPTFVFLAGLAGLGFGWLAKGRVGEWASERAGLAGFRFQVSGFRFHHSRSQPATCNLQPATDGPPPAPRLLSPSIAFVLVVVALGPALYDLIRIHPYELSYYNRAVGGLPGAMRRGFEVTYWYDAVTPGAIADINRWLPRNAGIQINLHTDVFGEWQDRGHPPLRGDLSFHGNSSGPHYVFLLTHGSMSNPTTRLLFAQRPAFPPVEHAGVRLFSIYDSAALARAQALDLMTASVSEWPQQGDPRTFPPKVSERVIALASRNPDAILAGAARLADGRAFREPPPDDPDVAQFLREVIPSDPGWAAVLRRLAEMIADAHPEALVQAARILVNRPQDVRRIILTEYYIPVDTSTGYLDEPHSF